LLLVVSILSINLMAQTIELPKPSATRNCDIVKALSERKSTREMVAEHVSLQDLSDILWAANGINRENEGKLTSPTARNSQDIEVYLCRPQGVYLYNNQKHILEMVSDVDLLNLLEISRATGAKDMLLIVADMAKYNGYDPKGDNKHFYEMGAVDAGIVSQNISLMCAAANIATVPRAMMVHKDIQKILEFGANKVIWLNHPIGYFVK
ncbi:nitroreductase family protein, partial [Bacteroidales bacterium OttesenSCG-928-K22]|nr:nitroreductase family protein [Bacteroidales bacterium OttesenSCG-928-K22]